MRRMFTVLTAAFAVVAFSSMTFAQAPAAEKATKPAAEKTVKAEKEDRAGCDLDREEGGEKGRYPDGHRQDCEVRRRHQDPDRDDEEG